MLRTAGVAAGERLEAVLELVCVVGGADCRSDEDPVGVQGMADDAANGMVLDVVEVGLASRQQIRARLAKEVLHALGDHKGGGQRESEPHPARVPFPQLAPPDARPGRAGLGGRARDEQQADEEDDGGRGDEGDEDEQPGGDLLGGLVGVGDGEVDGREGAVEGLDIFPAGAEGGDGAGEGQPGGSELRCDTYTMTIQSKR